MKKLDFASLQVRDIEKSKDFYTSKLGFELSEMKNSDAYIFKYNQGEASFAIRKPLGNIQDKELGNGVSLWFSIQENIDDFIASLAAKQVMTDGEIMYTPFGRAVHVMDLDGYKLTFLEEN